MSHYDVYADLHTHTNYSDGRLSPEVLVERAAERGIEVLSVTDHDTIGGLSAAQRAAMQNGVQLVTGVELTVMVENNIKHLLGYRFDTENSRLKTYLESFQSERHDRLHEIADLLIENGVGLKKSCLEKELQTTAAPGRPHLAAALVKSGCVGSYGEAFESLIGSNSPAFVPAPTRESQLAIEVIHEAGGVAVLAHPGQWTPSSVLRKLRDQGIDGIECIFPSHPEYLRDYYGSLCDSHDLMKTGGSDYHGGRRPNGDINFGQSGLSQGGWDALDLF